MTTQDNAGFIGLDGSGVYVTVTIDYLKREFEVNRHKTLNLARQHNFAYRIAQFEQGHFAMVSPDESQMHFVRTSDNAVVGSAAVFRFTRGAAEDTEGQDTAQSGNSALPVASREG